MNDKVSYNDYKNFKIPDIATGHPTMIVRDYNYNNLIDYDDQIPSELKPVMNDLKELYDQKKGVEMFNDKIQGIVNDYRSWRKENTNWYSEGYIPGDRRNYTDERINFYLSSPFYKNLVFEYYIIGIENHYERVHNFRKKAINIYRDITEQMNLADKVASDSMAFKINIKDYMHITGTYKLGDTRRRIVIEGDKIMGIDLAGIYPTSEVFPLSKNTFLSDQDYFFYVAKTNENGEVYAMKAHNGRNVFNFDKIE